MTAVFLAQFLAPDSLAGHLFSLALLLPTFAMTIRAYRMATILVQPEGITVRAFTRTRRFAWNEIGRFIVQSRKDGFGRPGYTLAVELGDGRTQRFGEFFSRLAPQGPTRAELIAAELNERHATA